MRVREGAARTSRSGRRDRSPFRTPLVHRTVAEDHLAGGGCSTLVTGCRVSYQSASCIVHDDHRAVIQIRDPWLYSLPSFKMKRASLHPQYDWLQSVRQLVDVQHAHSAAAAETLLRLKSLVTITASSCLPSSISFRSTSRTAGKSSRRSGCRASCYSAGDSACPIRDVRAGAWMNRASRRPVAVRAR